jgi:DNA polymerase I
MDKILFIDGLNSIWRACVKFGKIDPSIPDEIIFTFNFFRNLRPIIENFKPDKCFFVLEGHPKFRYELYSDYKANRFTKQASEKSRQTSQSFSKAKHLIINLLRHFPITICRADNYEADDVIATLCDNMKEENLTILSNDSDYIQLLQKDYSSINIYNPIKKTNMEAPTYSYVLWKCLNGDKSDNIPGLLKPKKAIETASNLDLFNKFMELKVNADDFNINRQLIEFRSVPLNEIHMFEGIKNFELLKQEFTNMRFDSMVNDPAWLKYTNTFSCLKF